MSTTPENELPNYLKSKRFVVSADGPLRAITEYHTLDYSGAVYVFEVDKTHRELAQKIHNPAQYFALNNEIYETATDWMSCGVVYERTPESIAPDCVGVVKDSIGGGVGGGLAQILMDLTKADGDNPAPLAPEQAEGALKMFGFDLKRALSGYGRGGGNETLPSH